MRQSCECRYCRPRSVVTSELDSIVPKKMLTVFYGAITVCSSKRVLFEGTVCKALPSSGQLLNSSTDSVTLLCPTWPDKYTSLHTNLDTSTMFFIVGLFKDDNVQPNVSTLGFHRNMVMQDDAANWEQDYWSVILIRAASINTLIASNKMQSRHKRSASSWTGSHFRNAGKIKNKSNLIYKIKYWLIQ